MSKRNISINLNNISNNEKKQLISDVLRKQNPDIDIQDKVIDIQEKKNKNNVKDGNNDEKGTNLVGVNKNIKVNENNSITFNIPKSVSVIFYLILFFVFMLKIILPISFIFLR